MDFEKAFDKINHSLFLYKLHHYCIQGTTIAWITNFLSNHRQAVVMDTRSSSIDFHSGVLQGSVLGPCLFLAYISDLPENLMSPAWLFADNTAVYKYNVVQAPKDHEQL